jgi:hypothetical protein
MSGTVVAGSVNEAAATCTVLLSTNDESAPTAGILLNAVTENVNGVLVIPKDDSHVWVAEIDKGKWGLIKTSDVKKVIVKISGTEELIVESGKAVFNGGSNHGMVKVAALVSKLNAVETDLNNLKAAFNAMLTTAAGFPPAPIPGTALSAFLATGWSAYAAAAIATSVQTELENTNVKH